LSVRRLLKKARGSAPNLEGGDPVGVRNPKPPISL
jgi:hypothetical protein